MLGFIFTSLFSLLFVRTSFHAVHISYGSVTISRDSINGELTFFKDDWSKAVEHWHHRALANQAPAIQSWMQTEYFRAHIRLWTNSFASPISIAIQPQSDSDLSVIYRFTAPISPSCNKIILDSRVIFSEYGDQMNLMTIKTPEETSNIIFTADHPTTTIKL